MLSGAAGQLDTVDCYDFSIYGGEGGVQDTGETEVIEGKPCMVFALGTDRDDQFVRERYYAVCDNLVYSYDAEVDA